MYLASVWLSGGLLGLVIAALNGLAVIAVWRMYRAREEQERIDRERSQRLLTEVLGLVEGAQALQSSALALERSIHELLAVAAQSRAARHNDNE